MPAIFAQTLKLAQPAWGRKSRSEAVRQAGARFLESFAARAEALRIAWRVQVGSGSECLQIVLDGHASGLRPRRAGARRR